jgi:YebC/PmpR family DNA-binding regulatory protein
VSGHSKWSSIKHQKAVTDSRRGALFTKLGNNIAVAARNGADPSSNFSLRLAVDKAKLANMPNTNIQRSIDRGSGKLGGDQIQEVMYEGYGPGGVGILVEGATDNINRTLPFIRLAFSKHGGRIADKGSVAFHFNRRGIIRVKAKGDDLLMLALDAGAEDVAEEDEESIIYTDPKNLSSVSDKLKEADIEITDTEIGFVPKETMKITDKDTAGKIIRLMDALDEVDDVTAVHHNFEIPEELLASE